MNEVFEVTSGAARLRCQVTGSGPALVCLHAGVADRRVWAGATPLFAERFRVVAYDRRGFGSTTYEPESFSHVADLESVLQAVTRDRVVLIGNSLGGKVALDYTLDNPDRVSALVLVAPAITGAPMPTEFSPRVEALAAATETADDAGDVDEVNRLEAHLWLDGPESDEGRIGGEERELFLDMNDVALRAPEPGVEIEAQSAWDRLENLSVPTLMLVGDLDLRFYRAEAEAVATRAANAKFVLLEGVAHLPMLERPSEFAAAVESFLDSG